MKLSLISIAHVGSLGFTNVFASKTTISRVQYNAKNTLFETKTTNTGRTGAEFELVSGKARSIIITTFSEDMKKLYQSGLVVTENGGKKPKTILLEVFLAKERKLLYHMAIVMVELAYHIQQTAILIIIRIYCILFLFLKSNGGYLYAKTVTL